MERLNVIMDRAQGQPENSGHAMLEVFAGLKDAIDHINRKVEKIPSIEQNVARICVHFDGNPTLLERLVKAETLAENAALANEKLGEAMQRQIDRASSMAKWAIGLAVTVLLGVAGMLIATRGSV